MAVCYQHARHCTRTHQRQTNRISVKSLLPSRSIQLRCARAHVCECVCVMCVCISAVNHPLACQCIGVAFTKSAFIAVRSRAPFSFSVLSVLCVLVSVYVCVCMCLARSDLI